MADPGLRAASTFKFEHALRVQPLKMVHFIQRPPRLAKPAAQALQAEPKAVVAAEDGQRWCGLDGWTDPAPPAEGGILCRRTGLTVRFGRSGGSAGANLLPFTPEGSPTAQLHYTVDGTAVDHPLEVQLDVHDQFLKLVAPFADTPEGRSSYDVTMRALSTPPGVRITLAYTHSFDTPDETARPEPEEPPGPRPRPRPVPDRLRDRLRDRIPIVRDHRTTPRIRRPGKKAREDLLAPSFDARLAFRPEVLDVLAQRPEIRRPDPRPPTTTRYTRVTLARVQTFSDLFRDQRDARAFPDRLRFDLPGGWGQLSLGGDRKVYYQATAREDTFRYLPTEFRLGYFVDADGVSGQPPVRVTQYRDDQGSQHFTVTLTAVPLLDDAARQRLETHLREVVLSGLLPFVRLEQAGGLGARFESAFTAGSATDEVLLPTGVRSDVASLDIDDRLVLRFDLPAELYEIFTQLLLGGLRGQVVVTAQDFQERIPVRIELDDVVVKAVDVGRAPATGDAPGVFLWLADSAQAAADQPVMVAAAAEAKIELAVENTLPHPVRVPSLKAYLLHLGTVPGNIWDAEEVDLVPGGVDLTGGGPPAEGRRLVVPVVPGDIPAWDETVVRVGQLAVDGGSAVDWLRRVHQDPSLQAAEFDLRFEVLGVPGAERVQLLRLRVLVDGGTEVRQSREVRPGEPFTWAMTMTMDELAGLDGVRPSFTLEYDCVYLDGGISLPQRLELPLSATEVFLRPVVETPTSTYTLTIRPAGGGEEMAEGLSRPDALARIEAVRAQGARWSVYAREPSTPAPEVPDGSGAGDPTVPDGPDGGAGTVTLVTDLLSPAFDRGEITTVFVTLQADADGAPQTTLSFSPDRRQSQTWRPASGSAPPFRYAVTYLLPGQPPRQKTGVETGAVLLLDPAGP